MVDLSSWDIPTVGWGAVVSSTGIEARQLRSAVDRRVLKFGVKQSNRLMFTYRERFGIDVAAMLTSLWVPISVACDVATAIAPHIYSIHQFWSEVYVKECTAGLQTEALAEDDALVERMKAAINPNIEDVPELSLLVEQIDGTANISFFSNRSNWLPADDCPIDIVRKYPRVSLSISMTAAMKRHVMYIIGDHDNIYSLDEED